MSRDISWINEIVNNTDRTYTMWCWDTDNEGEFNDGSGVVGRNDGGERFDIEPRSHIYCRGCGVPDGGDKDGFPKARVICEKSKVEPSGPDLPGDPGRGLQINRVAFGEDKDRISMRDRKTEREVGHIEFPRGLEQNLILRIEEHGIFLDVEEEQISTEWKAYLAGKEAGAFFENLFTELAKVALEVTLGAALAA